MIRQPKEGVAGKLLPTKKTPLNSEGIRVMTPAEWGHLQGFIGYAFTDSNGVDNFSFPEGTTRAQQYKQFGNSVTIPVIEEMAYFMLDCFDKMNECQLDLIVQMAKNSEYITRRDVIEQLRVTPNRANYILRKAKHAGKIIFSGKSKRGRYVRYKLKQE